MSVKEIRSLYLAAPFKPFDIVLTNGARVLVDHPEFMSFSRDFQTVYVSQIDGGSKRIDVKLIIGLDDAKNGARRRKR
jgi:hypothetical protein